MMIAIWLCTSISLGLWSAACWGLHAVLTFAPGRIGELKPMIEQIPYGDRMDEWIPGWQIVVQFALDIAQGLLATVSGAAPWFAWVIWGTGSVILLLLAGVVSFAVVLIRNEMKRPPPNHPALPSAPR